jgi:hypothetical protein
LLPTLRKLCVVSIRRRRCRHERSMEHVMDEEARRTEEGGREREMEMEREKRGGEGEVGKTSSWRFFPTIVYSTPRLPTFSDGEAIRGFAR